MGPQRHNYWRHSEERYIFKNFCSLNSKKEEKSSDQIQEEGWEVQDGSTRVRRVVNSGQMLPVEEGGKEEGGLGGDLGM